MLYFMEAQSDKIDVDAYFPSAGPFGSADGVGGQGSVLVRSGRSMVVAGDQTGRIYMMMK